MKNYNIISKSKDGLSYVDQDAVVRFLKNKLNYRLSKVKGSDNKFWIQGQEIKGKLYDLIDGPKYYQLVVERFDFGISASGDFNSWSMAGQIRDEMKEAV